MLNLELPAIDLESPFIIISFSKETKLFLSFEFLKKYPNSHQKGRSYEHNGRFLKPQFWMSLKKKILCTKLCVNARYLKLEIRWLFGSLFKKQMYVFLHIQIWKSHSVSNNFVSLVTDCGLNNHKGQKSQSP